MPFFVLYVCCLVVLVGFSLGGIGANHCRLRHIGWSKSCHGLTSRPRETSSVGFLDELLVLFCYSAASGADLLAGTLPLRYFSVSFARKVPTWRLPGRGSIASFLASGKLVRDGPCAMSAALGGAGVCLASGSGGGVRRVRLWKRLRDPLGSDSGLPSVKFLRVHQEAEGHVPGFDREGIG